MITIQWIIIKRLLMDSLLHYLYLTTPLLLGESHFGLFDDMKTIFETNLSPIYIYYANRVLVEIANTYVQSVCRFQVLGASYR